MSLPLQPVISFSVINYVVMMRCPTRVAQLIFFIYIPAIFSLLFINHVESPWYIYD